MLFRFLPVLLGGFIVPTLLAAQSTITVEPGQRLVDIAEQAYGDADRWREICEANSDVLESCDLIFPGQVLVLPELSDTPQADATPGGVVAQTETPADGNLALLANTPEDGMGWFGGATQSGLTITRLGTGQTPDGLSYADYNVSGTANASFVSSFYRSQRSLSVAQPGEAFRAEAQFQTLGGDTNSVGEVALFIVETKDEGFVDFTASPSRKAENEGEWVTVTAQRTVTEPDSNGVRLAIVLRRIGTGNKVDYSFRVAGLRLERVDN